MPRIRLVLALTVLTAFFCGRAADAAMQSFETKSVAAGWKPARRINSVHILAPDATATGRLFIDCVAFDLRTRGPRADDQQPWAGRPELIKQPGNPGLHDSRDVSVGRPWLPKLAPADKIPPRQLDEMKQLERRFLRGAAFGNWLDPGPMESLRNGLAITCCAKRRQVHRLVGGRLPP